SFRPARCKISKPIETICICGSRLPHRPRNRPGLHYLVERARSKSTDPGAEVTRCRGRDQVAQPAASVGDAYRDQLGIAGSVAEGLDPHAESTYADLVVQLGQPSLQKSTLRPLPREPDSAFVGRPGLCRSPQSPAKVRPRCVHQVIVVQIAAFKDGADQP